MESGRTDRDDATARLAALSADRAALADRAMQPWWYDVLGLAVFALLSVVAVGNVVVPLVGVHQSWALVVAGVVAGLTVGVTSRWAGRLYVRHLREEL